MMGILTVFQKIPSGLTDKAETLLKFVGLHQKRKLKSRRSFFWPTKIIRTSNGINE